MTGAQVQSTIDIDEILHLAAQGIQFVGTTPGKSRSDWTGWPDLATSDPDTLKQWIADSYSLVTVPKRGKSFVVDIDDQKACKKLGMPMPGISYWVETPSGGLHGYGLSNAAIEALGANLITVYDPANPKRPILELKMHNSTVAAPTASRFGMEGKKDGVYLPSTPGANLGHGLSPEFMPWINKHGVKSGCTRNGSGKPPEFHEEFERPDFLDNYECTELDAGMVGDAFHVVPESCPLCGGENPRGATVPSAKAKFMFGDGWWAYKCHRCGANKEELHNRFDEYDGEVFAPGDDWAGLEAADAGENMEETATANTLDPSFLNDDLDEDDKQEVIEAKKTAAVMAFALTDLGNGERFKWRYGPEFAWTSATGWLHCADGVWHRDETQQAEQAMQAVVRKIQEEAELYDSEEMQGAVVGWAKKSESNAKIVAGLSTAEALLAKDYTEFDRKRGVLNLSNGTLELATGKFYKHDPGDMLTKISPVAYDPAAKCPSWERFVSEVMGGNERLIGFLKRAMGYTISDETGDQAGFIPYGFGGTGKSTALNVLKGVMGDYAKTADAEMFMLKRGDSGQPFDLAGLEGIRGLLAVETEENKHMAVAKFKRMTGNDTIRACFKHRDWYEFTPCWKIWLATNSRPHANAGDDAYWERIKVIPFTVKFRGTDKQVKDLSDILLAEEASGILNWLLDGYREWKQVGLQAPNEVKVAVVEWQEAEDWLRRFLDETVEPTTDKNQFVLKSELFSRFDQWANRTKEVKNISDQEFSEEMRKRGHEAKPVRRGDKTPRCWIGIKVKDVDYHASDVPDMPY